MSEDKEIISAWIDDAIESGEVDSLQAARDTGGYSTAARYQMIGDAIRGNVTDASMIDISGRVSEAVSREPALAPSVEPASSPKPVAEPLLGLGSWLKPLGGVAVAATVAMVMVVTLTDQQTDSGEPVVAAADQQPGQAIPVNHADPAYTGPGYAMPAVNLNTYVTEHSESAAQDTMQGMLPYARAVSYGSDKNPSRQSSAEDKQNVFNPGK